MSRSFWLAFLVSDIPRDAASFLTIGGQPPILETQFRHAKTGQRIDIYPLSIGIRLYERRTITREDMRRSTNV